VYVSRSGHVYVSRGGHVYVSRSGHVYVSMSGHGYVSRGYRSCLCFYEFPAGFWNCSESGHFCFFFILFYSNFFFTYT
jgi:hypothetical protein